MLMAADFARALDPALLACDADITLDDWQADFVRSDAPQTIMLIPRQHGKTEASVVKALSVATTEADSLILIASPAQRLSDEFVLRARKTYARVKDAPALVGDAARRIEFENGSRILALPGDNDGDTLRGLANCRSRFWMNARGFRIPWSPPFDRCLRPTSAARSSTFRRRQASAAYFLKRGRPTILNGIGFALIWGRAPASRRNSWLASARTLARQNSVKSTFANSSIPIPQRSTPHW